MKTILILGASSDIGIATIKEIVKEYDRVWAHYNSDDTSIIELQKEFGDSIIPIKANFMDSESVLEMIQTIKESEVLPDHIVHMCGIKARNKSFTKWTNEDYYNEYTVSVIAFTQIIREFVPHMISQNAGKIIMILSSFVCGVSPKYQSPYIVSKYALLGLMKNLAAEYSDRGISINAISPDMVNTKFNDQINRKIKEINAEKSPLKRNLEVADIVPTIKYLLSGDSNNVTGVNIPITAGIEY